MSLPYEYELKLLGNRPSLTKVFNTLLEKADDVYVPDRYVFDTVYYDTADQRYRNSGYSLRHREAQGKFKSSLELKELYGEENGISKRVELGVKGGSFLSLYFGLLSDNRFPDKLRWHVAGSLGSQFKTVVDRIEQPFSVNLDGKRHELELALDKIFFVNGKEYHGPEDELEIEVKSDTVDKDLVSWLQETVSKSPDVTQTSVSKAVRGLTKLRL